MNIHAIHQRNGQFGMLARGADVPGVAATMQAEHDRPLRSGHVHIENLQGKPHHKREHDIFIYKITPAGRKILKEWSSTPRTRKRNARLRCRGWRRGAPRRSRPTSPAARTCGASGAWRGGAARRRRRRTATRRAPPHPPPAARRAARAPWVAVAAAAASEAASEMGRRRVWRVWGVWEEKDLDSRGRRREEEREAKGGS